MTLRLKPQDPVRAKEYFETRLAFVIGPVELRLLLRQPDAGSVIDVREPAQFMRCHLPGSINVPEPRWDSFEGLFRDQVNVICGPGGLSLLSARAALYFARRGFPVMELAGGVAGWCELGFETKSGTTDWDVNRPELQNTG